MPEGAFGELRRVTAELEAALRSQLAYDKINYLLLMMVDPHVHFHVLPRYSTPHSFLGHEFPDPCWPGPPDLSKTLDVDSSVFELLRRALSSAWPQEPVISA